MQNTGTKGKVQFTQWEKHLRHHGKKKRRYNAIRTLFLKLKPCPAEQTSNHNENRPFFSLACGAWIHQQYTELFCNYQRSPAQIRMNITNKAELQMSFIIAEMVVVMGYI